MEKYFLESLERIAGAHGGTLKRQAMCWPLNIEAIAKNDFRRGVLASVVQLYCSACRDLPEVRKAALDLGFEPFLEQVEGE